MLSSDITRYGWKEERRRRKNETASLIRLFFLLLFSCFIIDFSLVYSSLFFLSFAFSHTLCNVFINLISQHFCPHAWWIYAMCVCEWKINIRRYEHNFDGRLYIYYFFSRSVVCAEREEKRRSLGDSRWKIKREESLIKLRSIHFAAAEHTYIKWKVIQFSTLEQIFLLLLGCRRVCRLLSSLSQYWLSTEHCIYWAVKL